MRALPMERLSYEAEYKVGDIYITVTLEKISYTHDYAVSLHTVDRTGGVNWQEELVDTWPTPELALMDGVIEATWRQAQELEAEPRDEEALERRYGADLESDPVHTEHDYNGDT